MIDIKRGGTKEEFVHESNNTLRTNILSIFWKMRAYLEQKIIFTAFVFSHYVVDHATP